MKQDTRSRTTLIVLLAMAALGVGAVMTRSGAVEFGGWVILSSGVLMPVYWYISRRIKDRQRAQQDEANGGTPGG